MSGILIARVVMDREREGSFFWMLSGTMVISMVEGSRYRDRWCSEKGIRVRNGWMGVLAIQSPLFRGGAESCRDPSCIDDPFKDSSNIDW